MTNPIRRVLGRPAAPRPTPGRPPADSRPAAPPERPRLADAVTQVEFAVTQSLDSADAPAFAARLAQILALGPRYLVIDLSACPFLDATAITLLLDVHRELLRADGALILRAPTPRVRGLLGLARADRVLRVLTNPAEEPRYAAAANRPEPWPGRNPGAATGAGPGRPPAASASGGARS